MSEPTSREVTVLNAALELGPAERAAYLEEACAGDSALRQQVEDLLRAHDAAEGFLETPPAGLDLTRTFGATVPPTEKPGDKIGRYKLLQQIGEGGCGVVYMAEQEEPVRRRVAVKVIKLGMDTKQVIARFEAERQAVALMDHPNIAKVFDAGATETGRPYFVMELVRGTRITDFCDQNNASTEDRLKLFIQVCQAIQHAHQKGVIHRDIKPSNILVTVNDGVPVPKVIDFGIAKATQGRLTDQTLFTAFEQFIGTPAYMSPEQAVLTSLDIDTRSDIYSLGVLLYELLTGRTPFDQQELLAAGLDEMRRTIREKQPPRPSTRLSTMAADALTTTAKRHDTDALKLIHRLRGDLDWIVMKALEKDRARRYGTANGLANDIQRHLKCEPVLARPPSRLYEFQKTVRRHKFGFAASAAVMTVLAAGVAVSTSQAVRLAKEHRVATEKLFDSYLAQARARRRDSREGQRFESLETVAKAAAIRSSLELRNEAIASLALADLRFAYAHDSVDPDGECWDANLDLRAARRPLGTSVRRIQDDRQIALLPSLGAAAFPRNAFSPDGRYLAASYGNDRTILWDINQQQLSISNIPGGICAEFSLDSQTLTVPCGDGEIRRFGLDPIRPLPSLTVNRRYHGLKLRPQGNWFAANELDKADLELRDLQDGSLVRTLNHPSHIGACAWSNDGMYLAVGCEGGKIFIWNAVANEKPRELEGHQDTVTSVGFSHSGSLLASSSWDDQFCLWDLAAGRSLLTARGWSYQATFSADDRRIGFVQRARQTGSLEFTPSSVFRRLSCKPSSFRGSWSADVSPDGRLVAAAFHEGIRIWTDCHPGEPFFLPAASCYSVIFTPDGTGLITCGQSGIARWPLRRISGTTADDLRIGPRQPIRERGDLNYAALSRDGRWIAAANPGAHEVSIFEVPQPTNHFGLVSHPWIQFPAMSPDGRWVAAGNFKDSEVNVWEFESRRVVFTLPTRPAFVGFSPNNRWLLTTGATYDLWETGSWKHRYALTRPGSEGGASSLAFSPDATTLAITRDPRVIQLIMAETGQVLADLEAPSKASISFLRFSPDGSQLLALQWDQQVQVWDLRRLRAELTKLNLDWNAPPIPAEKSAGPPPKPLHISLEEPRQ